MKIINMQLAIDLILATPQCKEEVGEDADSPANRIKPFNCEIFLLEVVRQSNTERTEVGSGA